MEGSKPDGEICWSYTAVLFQTLRWIVMLISGQYIMLIAGGVQLAAQ